MCCLNEIWFLCNFETSLNSIKYESIRIEKPDQEIWGRSCFLSRISSGSFGAKVSRYFWEVDPGLLTWLFDPNIKVKYHNVISLWKGVTYGSKRFYNIDTRCNFRTPSRLFRGRISFGSRRIPPKSGGIGRKGGKQEKQFWKWKSFLPFFEKMFFLLKVFKETIEINSRARAWGQCYKTVYIRNLRMFVIS